MRICNIVTTSELCQHGPRLSTVVEIGDISYLVEPGPTVSVAIYPTMQRALVLKVDREP